MPVLVEDTVPVLGEIGEPAAVAVAVPALGKEMVEVDIEQHARETTVGRAQPPTSRGENRVAIGVRVDPLMGTNSRLDAWPERSNAARADEIGEDLADLSLGLGAREQEMGQIVHR